MSDTFVRVTGLETIKTLSGAISLPSFTVETLAERAGVAPSLASTVLNRYSEAFERLPTPPRATRGRPPVTWRLRGDRVDEVAAKVRSLQSDLAPGQEGRPAAGPPDAELAEASLLMAANSLSNASASDPGNATTLVAAARDALVTAGFNEDGTSWAGGPQAGEQAPAARLVAAVADVVDACVKGDQAGIDRTQAHAFPRLIDARAHMSADQWLPLANKVVTAPGTVLWGPVVVSAHDSPLLKLFPTLKPVGQSGKLIDGFHVVTDSRSEWDSHATSGTCVLFPKGAIDWTPKSTPEHLDCLVVSPRTDMLQPALDRGAKFVLDRGPAKTRGSIAEVINRFAIGLEKPGQGLTSPSTLSVSEDV